MGTVLKLALDHQAVPLHLELLGVAHLGDVQLLGNLGAHLGGVAVNGLTASDNQVEADFPQGGGDDGGGGIGVGTAELPCGEEIGLVHTHGQSLPQGPLRLGRTHAQGAHCAAALLPQAQGGFQPGLVVVVDNTGHALADQSVGFRVQLHLGGIGDLLDTYNNFHLSVPLISASWSRK